MEKRFLGGAEQQHGSKTQHSGVNRKEKAQRRSVLLQLISSRLLLMVVLALSGVAANCARNPVTGKRQIVLVSESQEIALGQQSDPQIRDEYGVVDNQALQRYVESIGRRLVSVSHRPNLEWHFAVV